MSPHDNLLDLDEVRERLKKVHGKEYWRSLEELAHGEDFQAWIEREFSGPAGGWTDPVHRRQFLILMAASLGLAGLSGCSPAPAELIVPHVRPPEGIVPGQKRYFATAMSFAGDALGLLVESHEGRPTKIEGNPDHPGSPRPAGSPPQARYGATDIFAQAALLTLYDPARSATVTHLGNISTWENLVDTMGTFMRTRAERVRLRILTESVNSPSLGQKINALLALYPRAKWYVHEPVGLENLRQGARLAFGEDVVAQYRLQRASVILALDADFLCQGPGHVRHHHDFAQRRRVRQNQYQWMNRLYVVESMPTGTGALADHRLALCSGDVAAFARGLASRLDPEDPAYRSLAQGLTLPIALPWLEALSDDLRANQGSSIIIAGAGQPPMVHALAHAMNDFLGNVGQTVHYTRPATIEPATGALRELAAEMDAGEVDVLVVLGGNPAYTAPVDLRFAERMNRVPLRIHLGLYEDETAALCHWHVPEAHFLEAWGDVRSQDGTLSLIQPLIVPLHGGRSALEFLSLLTDTTEHAGESLVQAYWRSLFDPSNRLHESVRADWQNQGLLGAFLGNFERWWRQALQDGRVEGTQSIPRTVHLQREWMVPAPVAQPVSRRSRNLEIVFRPDPTIYDGRFAPNGWLQELPKPISKLTWDNAFYLSPATAVHLGFAPENHPEQANQKVAVLRYAERQIEGPLWVLPGHADDAITVHLGYGRSRAGRIATGLGFNAYALRTSDAPWFARGAILNSTGRTYALACTQHHHLMENRDLVRAGTVQDPPREPRPHRISLYDETQHQNDGPQWGMVIDLNVCSGCSACTIACQAENNIPIVGKEEVQRGRDMHWIRVDSYYRGASANPETYFQPVPCMHCENAPCELVCPVAATVHSSDGLNDMVYNRCVGTRYCSNNCPYKVRRFNFLQYADFNTESLRLMRNPQVTVRSRGVMEKCTYCVQRIRTTQIEAQREDRAIGDFEVMTACQAACPAGAIIFGNLNDRGESNRPRSQVGQLQSEPLHYALLEELNTRPRTTYLGAVKNPNPVIARLERGALPSTREVHDG